MEHKHTPQILEPELVCFVIFLSNMDIHRYTQILLYNAKYLHKSEENSYVLKHVEFS